MSKKSWFSLTFQSKI